MKEKGLVHEFSELLKSLSKKKDESIKDVEEFKKNFLVAIDARLDSLYHKKEYLVEIFSNKKELKKSRLGVWKKISRTNILITFKYLFSMPFIYVMIVPGVIMHFFLELYHQICFRLYGIPRVSPKEYFVFDRRLLPYLNWLERFNCFYCSYYNCLISYMQEIVGRTERFWCPIKHASRLERPHAHYDLFVEYDDAKTLRKDWKKLRKFKEIKKK